MRQLNIGLGVYLLRTIRMLSTEYVHTACPMVTIHIRCVHLLQIVQMLYFVLFLLVIVIAYGVALRSIWYPDEEFNWVSVREIFIKPYFNLYGNLYADQAWRTYFVVI